MQPGEHSRVVPVKLAGFPDGSKNALIHAPDSNDPRVKEFDALMRSKYPEGVNLPNE